MRGWFEGDVDQDITARLGRFRVLEGLSEAALARIAADSRWFGLPAGQELARVGADERALFFVLSGTLAVMVDDGRGRLETVAHVPAGETAGEMSLMTDEPPSARLFALRDTEILALDKAAFHRIVAEHPTLMRELCVLLIDRLRRATHRIVERHSGRSVAMVATDAGVGVRALAARVEAALAEMGLAVLVLDAADANRSADWYHRVELAHDIVLYVADEADSAWARQAERRADRLFLVTGERREPKGKPIDHPAHDVIVLVEDRPTRLLTTASLADQSVRHVVRETSPRDIERLARFVAGRAVGLVLSGGGARGFAHLGVVRAMRAAGVPIDAVGGTSMGAVIAAGVAMEWDDRELEARMRQAFVTSNPISDVALPTVAFFRGRKVDQLLATHFGDRRIEDLAVPFFCVTSDLTSGRDEAHRAGPLATALRASVALPGILPPALIDGHVHVDGGVMNNLPVDHMARLTVGSVVACDVSGDTSLVAARDGRSPPGILSILVRTGTVGNEWQRREAHRRATLLFEPPVGDLGFRDWQCFDRAIQRGLDCARTRFLSDPTLLERLGVSWSDALTMDGAGAIG